MKRPKDRPAFPANEGNFWWDVLAADLENPDVSISYSNLTTTNESEASINTAAQRTCFVENKWK